MNADEFLKASSDLCKYVVSYLENIRERRVLPEVQPGYMKSLLPEHLPDEPETFDDVMKDFEKIIMPGVTHWHSPRFNAYFPTANSYPAILADILCGAIGCIGFTWIASPACTELEVVMMDWLGEFIGLPQAFLAKNQTNGGGVIQGTASEATLVCVLSAKKKKLDEIKREGSNPRRNGPSLLVAYASDQSHSSVERATMLAGIQIRLLPSDDRCALRGDALRSAIEEDIAKGLVPFIVIATIGTTNSCAFDNLTEVGEVATEFGLWAHVDAAYAGGALVCEEHRNLVEGVHLMNSFNFNPHKWLLVNFDCSALWVKNSSDLVDAFNLDPLYLKHDHQGKVPDFRHWQIPLGRRFRSLKLWFVMRLYGKSGLQGHIRKQVQLAKDFEVFVRKDPKFEIFGEVVLGLVCFRFKGSNELNEKLLRTINDRGVNHLVPAKVKGIYFLRYSICSRYTESSDVEMAWTEIKKCSDIVSNPSE